MKKIITILISMILSIIFISCGGNQGIKLSKNNYQDYIIISISLSDYSSYTNNSTTKYICNVNIDTSAKSNYEFDDVSISIKVKMKSNMINPYQGTIENGDLVLSLDYTGKAHQVCAWNSLYSSYPSVKNIEYTVISITGTIK